ncbi:MAG: hypothetical protein E7056_04980 [Lentisphaerae bacterium]|nr:hypothetical protein [Lentisphaerota bacterium]
MDFSKLNRLWVNDLAGRENIHSVAIFRRSFVLDSPLQNGVLYIAADSDFIVSLDGVELRRGQFSDDPLRKTFTRIQLPDLSCGKHLLAVKVYYCGSDFATYSPGLPGLYIALEGGAFELLGDENFKCAWDNSFQRGKCAVTTPQLGFTTQYDLRAAEAWDSPELDDSAWQASCVLAPDKDVIMSMRPAAPQPCMRKFVDGKLVAWGMIQKSPLKFDGLNPGEIMAAACCYREVENKVLPCTLAPHEGYGTETDGLWLIADLGYEETGFIEFELDAPAGAEICYAHGEHIVDGHIRSDLFYRCFADKVIWRGGHGVFQLPFRRVGARYLELHIRYSAEDYSVIVRRVGLVPWRLPLTLDKDFECSSTEFELLYKNARHTLELCMHDHYEDCPWREQALYSYDSRWQMIYGYYIWGNYDFAAAALDLFAPGQKSDGHLRICAPTRLELVIPIYSFVWINALYEHYLFSGSKAVFERNKACAQKIVQLILSRYDESAGLLREDAGKDFWNFYEWRDRLNGHDKDRAGSFSALYNLYAVAALDAWSALSGDSSSEKVVKSIKATLQSQFFDAEKGLFASSIDKSGDKKYFHEHTQALFMLYALLPDELQKDLAQQLATGEAGVDASLSSLYLVTVALEKCGIDGSTILAKLMKYYSPMLENNTGTLWETARGSMDFGYAGSLCHGWSSLPVYVAKALVLGAKPLTAGWKKCRIAPQCCKLEHACGSIPTPYGNITVAWQGDGNAIKSLQITHPEAIEVEVNCPAAEVNVTVLKNGSVGKKPF